MPRNAQPARGERALHETWWRRRSDVVDVFDVDGALLDASTHSSLLWDLGDDLRGPGSSDRGNALGASRPAPEGGAETRSKVARPARLVNSTSPSSIFWGTTWDDDLHVGGPDSALVAQAHDEQLRGEGLLGVPCGAQLWQRPHSVHSRSRRAFHEVVDRAHARTVSSGDHRSRPRW